MIYSWLCNLKEFGANVRYLSRVPLRLGRLTRVRYTFEVSPDPKALTRAAPFHPSTWLKNEGEDTDRLAGLILGLNEYVEAENRSRDPKEQISWRLLNRPALGPTRYHFYFPESDRLFEQKIVRLFGAPDSQK